MNRRTLALTLGVILLILLTPTYALARTHIGDELPAADYQIGNGINIEEEAAMDQNMLPGLLPEQLKKQCTWIQYPDSSYYFRSAPSQGKGLFEGAMANASSTVMDALANVFFVITKGATYLGNNILLICFDDYFLRNSLNFIATGVREYASPFTGGDQNGFASILFTACLIILAIGIVFYILRAQLMKALTSLLLSALCVAFLLIYAGNVNQILPPILTFVNDVTGFAISSVSFIQNLDLGAEPSTDTSNNISINGQDLNTTQASLIGLSNEAWFVLVSGPWANGQFGTADYSRLRMTEEEKNRANEAIKPSIKPSILKNTGALSGGNNRKAFARNEMLKSDYIDTNYLASSEDVKDDFMTTITDPFLDHGQHQVIIAAAASGSAGKHFKAAFFSMFPALIFISLIAFLGLPVFIAQFLIMGMLIILPAVLIIGISGENGRAILFKFLKALLGFLSTKIIIGFYLGFTVMLAFKLSQIAAKASMIGTAGFIVCVIFGAAIYYRQHFYNACMGLFSFAPGMSPANIYSKTEDWLKTTGERVTKKTMSQSQAGRDTNKNSDNNGGQESKGSLPPQTNRQQTQTGKDIPRNWNAADENEYVSFHLKDLGHGKKNNNHYDDENEHDLLQNTRNIPLEAEYTGQKVFGQSKANEDEFTSIENGSTEEVPKANTISGSEVSEDMERDGKTELVQEAATQQVDTTEDINPNTKPVYNGDASNKQGEQGLQKRTADRTSSNTIGSSRKGENPVNVIPPWQNTTREKPASETPQEERREGGHTFNTKDTKNTQETPHISPEFNNPISSKEESNGHQFIYPDLTAEDHNVNDNISKVTVSTPPVLVEDDIQDKRQDHRDERHSDSRLSDRDDPLTRPGSRWYD